MNQLLYFVDGLQRVGNWEHARELGLGYAFPESLGVVSADFSGAGPGGTQGCVFGVDSERLGYYPDRQTWLKIPKGSGSHQLYVGFWKNARPGPEDLRVEEPLRGRPVKLRDGNEWTIPIARAWSDSEGNEGWYQALPGILTLSETNEWVSGGVEQRYAGLWEIACAYWNEIWQRTPDAKGEIRFDFHGAHDAAIAALAANYRIGRPEAGLLGLLDDKWYCAVKILDTLVDRHTYLSWSKKNLAKIQQTLDGSSTSAGEQATTPPTVPA
jgi:hypothetical protein